MTAEPWIPQPAPERATTTVEARCWCGFPLGRAGACPWHGIPCHDVAVVDDFEDVA